MKKLFVSDLDGTLFYNSNDINKPISDENIHAINKFVEDGNIFAIATARNHKFLEEIQNHLGFRPPYICYNGGKIIVEQYLEEYTLSLSDYKLFEDYFNENKIDGFVSTLSEGIYYQSNRKNYPYNFEGYDIENRKSLMFEGIDTSQSIYDINNKCHKILLIIKPELVLKVKEDLKDKFSDKYELVSSDIDNIDVVLKGRSKGKGIETLSSYYNIPIENIGVIGDSENDISMFNYSKNRFAMKNGIESLKNKADYIVESVAEALKIFTK